MTTNDLTIAIDPGSGGAIAWRGKRTAGLFKMPPESELMGKLDEIIVNESCCIPTFYLEKVGGFVGAKQPGSRMFSFGRNYGFILGILHAMGHRTVLVRPLEWQKGIPGVRVKGKAVDKAVRKRAIKEEATRLWAPLKVTLYAADAAMICEWGMKQ